MGAVEHALASGEGIRGVLPWVGSDVIDPEGRHLGRLAGVAVDRQAGAIRWFVVRSKRERHVAIPPWNATAGAGRVSVPWPATQVLRSPVVPGDGSFSARLEREICAAYGIEVTGDATLSRWERRRTTAMAALTVAGEVTWEPSARHDDDRRTTAEPQVAHLGAVPDAAPPPATDPPAPAPVPVTATARAVEVRLAPGGEPERRGTRHVRIGSVMIASPDAILRSALREVVEAVGQVVVAAEVADGRSARQGLTARYPDVAILDTDLQGLPAVDVVAAAVRDRLPTRFVIVVRSQQERRNAERALRDRGIVVPLSSGLPVLASVAAELAGRVAAARPA